jgi:hypothetical protein
MLEPAPPRLSAGAAARLDAAVASAMAARRAPRRLQRLALTAAPALVALALVLWISTREPQQSIPSYPMVDENELVSALQTWGGDVDQIITPDGEILFDEKDWNEADWQTFQTILEDFDPRGNGGSS